MNIFSLNNILPALMMLGFLYLVILTIQLFISKKINKYTLLVTLLFILVGYIGTTYINSQERQAEYTKAYRDRVIVSQIKNYTHFIFDTNLMGRLWSSDKGFIKMNDINKKNFAGKSWQEANEISNKLAEMCKKYNSSMTVKINRIDAGIKYDNEFSQVNITGETVSNNKNITGKQFTLIFISKIQPLATLTIHSVLIDWGDKMNLKGSTS
jgi:hypothetical protein